MAILEPYKGKCLDYLYGYAGISMAKTNAALDMKDPTLRNEVTRLVPNSMIILESKADLKKYENTNLPGEVIHCTGKSKPISFLRHLRNAIAHGYLKEDGNYFVVEDWDDEKKTNLTAKGRFTKKRIEDVLDLLIPLA